MTTLVLQYQLPLTSVTCYYEQTERAWVNTTLCSEKKTCDRIFDDKLK